MSESLKHYKRNIIIADLHRSKRISPDFDTEIRTIKDKCGNAGYPIRFICSIIHNFNMPPEDDVSVIMPTNLFDEKKPFILIEVSHCEVNETASLRSLIHLQMDNAECKIVIYCRRHEFTRIW